MLYSLRKICVILVKKKKKNIPKLIWKFSLFFERRSKRKHGTKQTIFHISGGEEWKPFAERLGLDAAEIRFLDSRTLNPCDAVLSYSRNQGYVTTAGHLYDVLVACGFPVIADLL